MAGARSDGFEVFYRCQYRSLVRALTVSCGDPDVAADVAAEAFVRTLERWSRVSTMASPGGWLHRVAFNLIARAGRRSQIEQRIGWQASRSASVAAVEPDLDLRAAVVALPPRMRQAIALRYVLGLTEADVALAMGTTTGSASATLATARHILETKLRAGASRTEVSAK